MDKFKIIFLNAEKIIIEPKDAANAIKSACSKNRSSWRPTGVCDCGHNEIMFPMQTCPPDQSPQYVLFAPINSLNRDDIAVALNIKFEHGLTLIGTFRYGDGLWGLWCKP